MGAYIAKKSILKFIDSIFLREDKLQSVEKETLLTVKRWVDGVKPADVRPVVTARWKPKTHHIINGAIAQDVDEWYGLVFQCNMCGEEMIGKSNYCPGCGAVMKGVNNDKY